MPTNTDPTIVLYLARAAKAPASSKKAQAEATAVAQRKLATARVNRPSVVAFVMSNGLYNLAPLPREYANAPALRTLDATADRYGFVVPSGDLKGKAPTQSLANSLRLWVLQNLAGFVRPEDLTVVVEVPAIG